MSVIIQLNESNASRRVVPLPPLVQSNGTSACTNESGATFFFSVGGVFYGSGGSISAISAPIGLYEALFSASKVSTLGQGAVHYSSGTALPSRTPIEIVATNSYDSMRYGLFALPNAAAEAAGGLITSGTGTGQLSVSVGSVGLKAQTHSQATITGINNILAGNYSGVTFETSNIKPANYSGVSFEILTGGIQTTSIGKGNYSGVSVEVKAKGIATSSIETANVYSYVSWGAAMEVGSTVSIHAGTHSSVTIQGLSNYANISSVTLNVGNHSGATIDGVRMLATPAERSISSSLLSTNMGSSRLLQEFLWSMRNKVTVSGLTMTVYLPDDATSAYTASVTTGLNAVLTVDGGGRP